MSIETAKAPFRPQLLLCPICLPHSRREEKKWDDFIRLHGTPRWNNSGGGLLFPGTCFLETMGDSLICAIFPPRLKGRQEKFRPRKGRQLHRKYHARG